MRYGRVVRHSSSSLNIASCLLPAVAGFREALSSQGSDSGSAWMVLSFRVCLLLALALPAYLPRSFAFMVLASSGFVCSS